MAKKQGKNITIKGVLYEDGISIEENESSSSDIYNNEEGKKIAFDSAAKDTVTSEATSQATQGGIQAIVTHVQSQAQSIGMSGLIAIGGGGAFQIEHMIDHGGQAVEKAEPMITELLETGTITPPPGHSKYGQEIPKVNSFLGIKVGDERKRAIEEKNKTDEEKAIEKAFQDAVRPPQPGDEEKDGSMTSIKERNRSMT